MLQRLRENRPLQGTLLILPTMLVMVLLLIIPLLLTVVTSFSQRGPDGQVIYNFTLENYIRLMGFTEDGGWDPLYLNILARSILLAFQTTFVVILMAYPLAYFIARAPEKRRKKQSRRNTLKQNALRRLNIIREVSSGFEPL